MNNVCNQMLSRYETSTSDDALNALHDVMQQSYVGGTLQRRLL